MEAYHEGTYFDTIMWFTNEESLTTVPEFLDVASLPPLQVNHIGAGRSESRRKVHSVNFVSLFNVYCHLAYSRILRPGLFSSYSIIVCAGEECDGGAAH